MVLRESKDNAYAKFWRANKEYYGIFQSDLFLLILSIHAHTHTHARTHTHIYVSIIIYICNVS